MWWMILGVDRQERNPLFQFPFCKQCFSKLTQLRTTPVNQEPSSGGPPPLHHSALFFPNVSNKYHHHQQHQHHQDNQRLEICGAADTLNPPFTIVYTHSCFRCNLFYSSQTLQYRWILSLTVAETTGGGFLSGRVTLFGDCLNYLFGQSATAFRSQIDTHKTNVEQAWALQYHALQVNLIGRLLSLERMNWATAFKSSRITRFPSTSASVKKSVNLNFKPAIVAATTLEVARSTAAMTPSIAAATSPRISVNQSPKVSTSLSSGRPRIPPLSPSLSPTSSPKHTSSQQQQRRRRRQSRLTSVNIRSSPFKSRATASFHTSSSSSMLTATNRRLIRTLHSYSKIRTMFETGKEIKSSKFRFPFLPCSISSIVFNSNHRSSSSSSSSSSNNSNNSSSITVVAAHSTVPTTSSLFASSCSKRDSSPANTNSGGDSNSGVDYNDGKKKVAIGCGVNEDNSSIRVINLQHQHHHQDDLIDYNINTVPLSYEEEDISDFLAAYSYSGGGGGGDQQLGTMKHDDNQQQPQLQLQDKLQSPQPQQEQQQQQTIKVEMDLNPDSQEEEEEEEEGGDGYVSEELCSSRSSNRSNDLYDSDDSGAVSEELISSSSSLSGGEEEEEEEEQMLTITPTTQDLIEAFGEMHLEIYSPQ